MIGKRSTTAVVEEVEETRDEVQAEAPAPEVEVPDEAETLAATEAADIDEPEVAEAGAEVGGADDDGAPALDPSHDPAAEAREKLAAKARLLSDARVATICESLLLVADKPLPEKAIQDATGLTPGRIRAAMAELAGHYREGVSGIVLHEVSAGWQLRTCPTSAEFVRRFLQVKPQRLTRAALETLAIVAYRQPVTRPEVEEIRGVDCGAVMKALLERGLLEVLGKKEEPGRPLLYGTTRVFLEFFNLKDLASLPTLREFHELNEEHQRIVEDSYPDAPEAEGAEASAAEPPGILDGIEPMRTDDSRPEDEAALEALDAAVKDTETKARAVSEALDGKAGQGAPADGDDDAEETAGPEETAGA